MISKRFLFPVLAVSLLCARQASAATLNAYVEPSAAKVGDTVTMSVVIDTEGVGVNAAQASIQYPPDSLEAVDVNPVGSVFNFWLDGPTFSNSSGRLSFTGGSTNGFNGHSLSVLRAHFKVKKAGTSEFAFISGVVSASDGSGTNLLKGMRGATVIVVESTSAAPTATAAIPKPTQITRKPVPAAQAPNAPKIDVAFYPDQKKWYNQMPPFLVKWTLPADISDVATALTKDPKTTPKTSEGLFDNKMFQVTDSGVWYLHLRFKNNVGWGDTVHYRIAIDTIPPSGFEVSSLQGQTTDTPNPTLTFSSADSLSGIDGYYLRVDDGALTRVEAARYALPILLPGKHAISVAARDLAGNETNAQLNITITPIASPTISPILNDVFVGEGALHAGGTALSGVAVVARLLRDNGEVVGSATTTVDEQGSWVAKFDHPLTKGDYRVEAYTRDARGATSYPVRTELFVVRARPFLVLAGIEVSETVFFLAMIVLLGLGYVVGWNVERRQRRKRGIRTLMSQRDVSSAFAQVRRDLTEALDRYRGQRACEAEATELRSIAKRVRDRIAQIEKYIIQNIEEINK